MSPVKTFSNRRRIGLCALAMALLAAPVLWWWGLTPLTVVLVAIFVSCLAAALYAWWLARRALRPLNAVKTPPAADGIHSRDQPWRR